MSTDHPTRRPRGSGEIFTKTDARGRDIYYGRWYAPNGARVKRRLGLVRAPGSRSGEGLTKTQAEAALRKLTGAVEAPSTVRDRVTVAVAADDYRAHAERQGRKPSTLRNIESDARLHLVPFFGDRPLDAITYRDVGDLVNALQGKRWRGARLSAKTIRNVVALLSALCNYGRLPQRAWCVSNPCDGVELPPVDECVDFRYLSLDEVDALVAAARPGECQAIDRAMYLTAPSTGLRLGELRALRWRDVDWAAGRIRVRQNYVLGQYGTPKSRRSTRSVPLVDEVGGELERLYQGSAFQDDDDLVFGHPLTGEPMHKASIHRRYKLAIKAAGIDSDHRFHDLRHTFGTLCASAGTPLRTLQEWMGHKDIKTTQRYADYAPLDNERELAEAALARRKPSTDTVPA